MEEYMKVKIKFNPEGMFGDCVEENFEATSIKFQSAFNGKMGIYLTEEDNIEFMYFAEDIAKMTIEKKDVPMVFNGTFQDGSSWTCHNVKQITCGKGLKPVIVGIVDMEEDYTSFSVIAKDESIYNRG
jgi:hypothetical protein